MSEIQWSGWVSEKVTFDMIRPNGVFYLSDPFVGSPKDCPFPHYASEDISSDTCVWVLYPSWQNKSQDLKPECYIKTSSINLAVAGIINAQPASHF